MTRWAPAVGLAATLLLDAGPRVAEAVDVLVTVGDVRDHSAVIWARTPRPGPVAVEIEPAGQPRGRQRLSAEAVPETDFTVKLRAERLVPGTRHTYRVTAAGESVAGEFVTAPEPAGRRPLSLVWSGDLGGGGRCRLPGVGYRIFEAMARRRPDVFVFAGDTIYADGRCPVPENVPGA